MEIVFPPRETILRLVVTSIDYQSFVSCVHPTADISDAIEIVTIADPADERPN